MKTMYLSPSVNSYQQVVSWFHLGLSCSLPHPTGSLEVNGTGRVVFPQRPQTGVERTLYQTEVRREVASASVWERLDSTLTICISSPHLILMM